MKNVVKLIHLPEIWKISMQNVTMKYKGLSYLTEFLYLLCGFSVFLDIILLFVFCLCAVFTVVRLNECIVGVCYCGRRVVPRNFEAKS